MRGYIFICLYIDNISTYLYIDMFASILEVSSCSATKLCLILSDPMDCSTPGFPVPHHLSEFAQVYTHWIGVQSFHLILWPPLLLLPTSDADLFQHQDLFQWVSYSHQVAKVSSSTDSNPISQNAISCPFFHKTVN